MRTTKMILSILALILAMILTAIMGGYVLYRMNHVKVDGTVYDLREEVLDLRGQEVAAEKYLLLQSVLPDTRVIWDIPFQGERYPEDTEKLTVSSLSEEDFESLKYFRSLEEIDASECRDYEAILKLQEQYPRLQVTFYIHMGQRKLDRELQELTVQRGDATGQELADAISYLPRLQSVTLSNPDIPAAELQALQEQYPEVIFTWNQELMGTVYDMNVTSLDISGTKPRNLQYVENAISYFPALQKLEMVGCGIPNEEMAAFRERARGKFQVIWGVQVGDAYLRTDEKGFVPSHHNQRVRNKDVGNLVYCEGLEAVDFGHIGVSNLEWVSGTPHLKYLILGDGDVRNEDILPLSQLKELVFLEIFMSPVTDITPLLEITSLRDLNLSRSYVDVKPLAQMTWLDNLWLQGNGVRYDDRLYLEEKLPDTHIDFTNHNTCHGNGWRKLPNYYAMRDTLGMYYMD